MSTMSPGSSGGGGGGAGGSSSSPSKSRKRKRSRSDASSSPGWDPDDDDGESSSGRGSRRDEELKFPSQIDVVAIAPGSAALDGAPENNNDDLASSDGSSAAAASASKSHTKPPERIRYEMLGAPTLVYRHAPSYLDPSTRPSALTPRQLSMALYMNEHPIKDWFTSERDRELRRRFNPSTARSPFLTSAHVPQPPRPWGRSHAWDWRHRGVQESECRSVRDLRRQAKYDADALAKELHVGNRESARWFWEGSERRNNGGRLFSEHVVARPADIQQRASPQTGFGLFCSEYIRQLEQSASDPDAVSGPREHFQIVYRAWNELSEEDRAGYGGRAKGTDLGLGGDDEKQGSDAKPNGKKSRHRSNAGKTTGFNIFRSEFMQSNVLAGDATAANKKAHLTKCSKHAGEVWKEMSEEEKSEYRERAKTLNASRTIAVDEAGEEQSSVATPPDRNGSKRTTAFHAFLSEHALRWKQSNPNAGKAERKLSLMKCSKEASAEWKGMTEKEKSVYREKARARNGDDAASIRSPPQQKYGKGKTTGFNIFRTEEWSRIKKESEPLHDDASAEDKKRYVKEHRDRISASWNGMTELEKSRYKSDAERRNSMPPASEVEESVREEDDGGSLAADAAFDRAAFFGISEHHRGQYPAPSEWQDYETTPYAKVNAGAGSEEPISVDSDVVPLLYDQYMRSSRDLVGSVPDYFSPFRGQDVGFGFHLDHNVPLEDVDAEKEHGSERDDDSESGDEVEQKSDREVGMHEVDGSLLQPNADGVTSHPTNDGWCEDHEGVGGPSGYGNCLITIPCWCKGCSRGSHSWLLVHPAGENLSSLALRRIHLPRGSSVDGRLAEEMVDVGGRILQISRCGESVPGFDTNNSSSTICFVARTSQYCSVIYARGSSEAVQNEGECSMEFRLQEKTRIDLRAPHRSSVLSFLPLHIACDPKSKVSYFSCPSFAILSRDYSGGCTTVHRVSLRDEPEVKTHSLSPSLAGISLIEFCRSDRMVVWAAARSVLVPKLTTGFFKARNGAVMGYGESLFRVDLRNDSATFVWSPSHAEFLSEGIHSINGLMPDASHEHLVWVSSSSACKVWALDARYKSAKVVVSWSLPSLCDDFGSHMAVTGTHGGGVLMSQPTASASSLADDNCAGGELSDQQPVMFSLRKDPSSYAVGVHQYPSARPRFHTRHLESSAFREVEKVKHDVASIARSAIFPLPDASGANFNVGIATVQCLATTCLAEKQLSQLGHESPPANVTYVLTMTSLGDIYCHSLLETNATECALARHFRGLPIGTKAIPIAGIAGRTSLNPRHLTIGLRNEFPAPSSSINPFVVLKAGDSAPFQSYDVDEVLDRAVEESYDAEEILDRRVDTPAMHNEKEEGCGVPRSDFKVMGSSEAVDHEVKYSLSRFVVAATEDGPSRAAVPTRRNQLISLPTNHTMVLFNNKALMDGGAVVQRPSEGRLIEQLRSSYYQNGNTQQVGVKSVWESDSE